MDGCVGLTAAAARPASGAEPVCCSRFAGRGVWRLGGSEPFFGRSREVFAAESVSRQLQDDPRVWGLPDPALATLGLWPFADQDRALSLIQARRRVAGGRSRKRPRLGNPLAAASGPGEESGSDSGSGSGSEC